MKEINRLQPITRVPSRAPSTGGIWRAPSNPVDQAIMLREMLRFGKNQLVLSCERTSQTNEGDVRSPVIVCSPENCEYPCFNCMMAVLIGKKSWVYYEHSERMFGP